MECFMNRHDQKINCFKHHVSKFRQTYAGYAGNDIQVEWVIEAKNNYAKGVVYDEVVGLYDTSTFGKGKTGFLFTDNYLYWKRSISKGIIRLDDIEKVTYYNENKRKDVDRCKNPQQNSSNQNPTTY